MYHSFLLPFFNSSGCVTERCLITSADVSQWLISYAGTDTQEMRSKLMQFPNSESDRVLPLDEEKRPILDGQHKQGHILASTTYFDILKNMLIALVFFKAESVRLHQYRCLNCVDRSVWTWRWLPSPSALAQANWWIFLPIWIGCACCPILRWWKAMGSFDASDRKISAPNDVLFCT